MIIVTNSGITKEQWNNIWEKLESWGFQLHVIQWKTLGHRGIL